MSEFKADYPTKEERRLMDDVERMGRALAEEHDKVMTITAELDAMTSRYSRAAADIASLEGELAEMKERAEGELPSYTEQRCAVENAKLKDQLAEAREDNWLIAQAVGIKKDEVYCTQSIVDRIAEARESTGRLEVKLFEQESTNRKLGAENAALRELLAQAADPCNELFEEWYGATNALLERIGE